MNTMEGGKKRSLRHRLRDRDAVKAEEKRARTEMERVRDVRKRTEEATQMPAFPVAGVDDTVRVLDKLMLTTSTDGAIGGVVHATLNMVDTTAALATYCVPTHGGTPSANGQGSAGNS